MHRNSLLSFKAAAFTVLSEAETPLTADQIVDAALERGVLQTGGKTPAATMGAQLYTDIKKKKKNSKFRKVGKGKFALAKQTTSVVTPELAIEEQNDRVREALLQQLLEMDPYQSEFLVAELLEKIGYESVEVTKQSGDKGIDVNASLRLDGITDVKTVIQVKRFKTGNNLSGSVITQLRGSAEVDQRGLVITTSNFTKSAKEESKAPNKMPVSLVNGEKLVDLLIKHEVGVNKKTTVVFSIDEDYFSKPAENEGVKIDVAKNRGLWPLPGGADSYVATLIEALEAVRDGANTTRKLSKWFLETYSLVKSEKTAYSYALVPKVLGLVEQYNGKIALTNEGASFLENRDLEDLYETISSNVFAFDDIVEFLKTTDEPQGQDEILEFLREAFDIEWKTHAQLNYRLNWLKNLNKVAKTGDGFQIQRC